ncbi:hypothetical protein E3O65_07210 [Cryobacterium breve]|uniref:Asp23/Gls24 family envelope stress response protein n=1 Tax=Cryobacterium breve TaxID=1259258 RepID=A0ABY2J1E5_9MICO|nr:hypothetical protein E3T20_09080 [Cryobacterium sp. TmT3-12]TFC98659.1 hypothetical protein E3O65_07210 [Cryobacterium breve]
MSTAPNRGRTTVSPRALNRLVCAVAADALGVSPTTVGAELTDDLGKLALTVSAPIRIASLTRVQGDPSIVSRTGGTIVARAEQARQHIQHRVGELTGSTLSRVTVRLTGADIQPEGRVK